MRYLDSGGRDPNETLGAWLRAIPATSVAAVRMQAGFFSHRSLPYVADLLDDLTVRNADIKLLIGSNDGMTSKADITSLQSHLGRDRPGLEVAIVRFSGSFFHSKTYHLTRLDGSATAYVGSANLTPKGLTQHVEAGLVVDTTDGDDPAVVAAIAAAVDDWFATGRSGLTLINSSTDLDALVAAGVIGVPRPTVPAAARPAAAPRLKALIPAPSIPATTAMSWSKRLEPSNAQRKPGGNNRGSITLTRGRAGDTQTFFRDVLFGTASWVASLTRTGQAVDRAWVPMRVVIDGVSLGVIPMEVTNSPYRQQGTRNNATSHLHIGDLAPQFAATNLTGKTLTIELKTDGSYDLTIA